MPMQCCVVMRVSVAPDELVYYRLRTWTCSLYSLGMLLFTLTAPNVRLMPSPTPFVSMYLYNICPVDMSLQCTLGPPDAYPLFICEHCEVGENVADLDHGLTEAL